jgi:hypothetical protein
VNEISIRNGIQSNEVSEQCSTLCADFKAAPVSVISVQTVMGHFDGYRGLDWALQTSYGSS